MRSRTEVVGVLKDWIRVGWGLLCALFIIGVFIAVLLGLMTLTAPVLLVIIACIFFFSGGKTE